MRTLIIGLDAFDPGKFEDLHARGKLPNLARYVERNAYRHLRVADPPQSEVSWTSIASGLSPGDHGIFDFVHRDPKTYRAYLSLLPIEKRLGSLRFVAPTRASTLFDKVAAQGFPATRLFWPATFPANLGSPVRTIPGLGTPDIHGKLGVGTLYSDDAEVGRGLSKVGFCHLNSGGTQTLTGYLSGPSRKRGEDSESPRIEFEFHVLDNRQGTLDLGHQSIDLELGRWSPVIELEFKMGWFYSLRAITRVIWTKTDSSNRLYFLPLQIHPLHTPWHYGTPKGLLKEMWQETGPFLTLGWPQDTTGLEEDCMNDEQFLELCESILSYRRRALLHELERFDEGVLAIVLDSLDRIQHMFWRNRPDIVEAWYGKLDSLVGEAEALLDSRSNTATQLLILSDHGFSTFEYKVHLNRWLIDHSYLTKKDNEGHSPDAITSADWSRSMAYALGLNSIYLNMKGREGSGTVSHEARESLIGRLSEELLSWIGPDGSKVVRRVQDGSEVFRGSQAALAPDLVVGYSTGYRASAETGLGYWASQAIVPNDDHWNSDHCIDSQLVPGVLFARHGLDDLNDPSYRDIPQLAIGTDPDPSRPFPPPKLAEEDMEVVEERLRSLGYL